MSLATGADLSVDNKKIIGSAQFRKQGYILQHGSLMFDYDKDNIFNIFGEIPQDEKITTLKETAPQITIETLCTSFINGIQEYFNIELKPFCF